MEVLRYDAVHNADMSLSTTGEWVKHGQLLSAARDVWLEVGVKRDGDDSAYRKALLDGAVALAAEGCDEAAIRLLMVVARASST